MSRATLRDEITVDAPADRLWRTVTDWPRQVDWIPLTSVRTAGGDGRGVGDRLEARTGLGPVGFLDTMVITHWSEPPAGTRVCEVLHTGRVVRGEGGFEVHPVMDTSSRFVWWETFELPLGPIGVAGWRVMAPVWQRGIHRALERLKSLAETDTG